MVLFPKAQAARRSNCIAPVIEYIIGVKKYASNKMKIITKEEMFQSLLLFHFLHADVRKTGFRIRLFFCGSGSGSGQKSSCGSGSGSWGYPGEGGWGKGKKLFFFSFFHVSDDS